MSGLNSIAVPIFKYVTIIGAGYAIIILPATFAGIIGKLSALMGAGLMSKGVNSINSVGKSIATTTTAAVLSAGRHKSRVRKRGADSDLSEAEVSKKREQEAFRKKMKGGSAFKSTILDVTGINTIVGKMNDIDDLRHHQQLSNAAKFSKARANELVNADKNLTSKIEKNIQADQKKLEKAEEEIKKLEALEIKDDATQKKLKTHMDTVERLTSPDSTLTRNQQALETVKTFSEAKNNLDYMNRNELLNVAKSMNLKVNSTTKKDDILNTINTSGKEEISNLHQQHKTGEYSKVMQTKLDISTLTHSEKMNYYKNNTFTLNKDELVNYHHEHSRGYSKGTDIEKIDNDFIQNIQNHYTSAQGAKNQDKMHMKGDKNHKTSQLKLAEDIIKIKKQK